jgi:hypothetical protein
MEGGFFLVQRVDLGQGGGQRIRGIEVIEHERPFGAERGDRVALLRLRERHHELRVGA